MPPSDEANEIVLSLSDHFLAVIIKNKKELGIEVFKYTQHTTYSEEKITYLTHSLEELVTIQVERKLDGK